MTSHEAKNPISRLNLKSQSSQFLTHGAQVRGRRSIFIAQYDRLRSASFTIADECPPTLNERSAQGFQTISSHLAIDDYFRVLIGNCL
jgi:hypothetical protein